MLVRLLLVVFVLAGQFPFCICTCTAHHHSPIATEEESENSDHPESQHEHDPDCPAANPRPCLKAAPIPPIAHPPMADLSLSVAVCLPICTALVTDFLDPPPHRPPLPLYLVYLVLRN